MFRVSSSQNMPKSALCSLLVVLFSQAAKAQQYPPDALPNLTKTELTAFYQGQKTFNTVFTSRTGLGPIFNGDSCQECHPNANASQRICDVIGDNTALQIALGGPLIQTESLRGYLAETIPTEVPVSVRRAPNLRGLGLVGGIADSVLLDEQTWQENNYEGKYAGKANLVIDAVTGDQRVGRIGWKSQHPNVTSFAAEAFLREIGITTPYFPNEEAPYNDPNNLKGSSRRPNDNGGVVTRVGQYLDLLAPPPRTIPSDPEAMDMIDAGETLFVSVECGVCHHKLFITVEHPVAALSQQVFYPYSDFLLHDLGAAGDVVQEGTDRDGQPISPAAVRTPPLWGGRNNPRLWHDGSVAQRDYETAIELHEGQGRASKLLYLSLTEEEKQAVLAFLDSL